MNPNKRVHAIVYGVVQGVNFRYHTRRAARSLLLVGCVRNLADGTVEVVAEGPPPQLDALVAVLHRGPSAARVDHLDLSWHAPTGEFVAFDMM